MSLTLDQKKARSALFGAPITPLSHNSTHHTHTHTILTFLFCITNPGLTWTNTADWLQLIHHYLISMTVISTMSTYNMPSYTPGMRSVCEPSAACGFLSACWTYLMYWLSLTAICTKLACKSSVVYKTISSVTCKITTLLTSLTRVVKNLSYTLPR